MTINVALATAEAIVFGCDSTSSVTQSMLNPFALPYTQDAQGKYKVEFDQKNLTSVVTNSWDGTKKMLMISEGNNPVVAVTAGMARLNERSMASLALEFQQQNELTGSIEDYIEKFSVFMRDCYEEHYKKHPAPVPFQTGPKFLIGGFGAHADYPALFRVKTKENTVEKHLDKGRSGVYWAGQANAVQRIIFGLDGALMHQIQQQAPNLPLAEHQTKISFANLPLQEAVNLVSYLVLVQMGLSRFEDGVPTVGGRIHIGVITKGRFRLLNEPELVHRHIGFFNED